MGRVIPVRLGHVETSRYLPAPTTNCGIVESDRSVFPRDNRIMDSFNDPFQAITGSITPIASEADLVTANDLDSLWRERLRQVVAMMREMSQQTDPQTMVKAYDRRMREMMPIGGRISLSRRDLEAPWFRITRFTGWREEINPWTQKDRLPLLRGGLFAELLYGDEPDLRLHLRPDPDDPAAPYLEGFGSLAAMPHYDQGVALNMTLLLRPEPDGFTWEQLPGMVWMGNLFGRATQNLVLTNQLLQANAQLERELRTVADIQRSLLPRSLPPIPGLDMAAHYRTSRHAGGDYYDVFALPGGRYGLLIADVSGHGTPAAVVMAITHSLVHTYIEPCDDPAALLSYLNQQLTTRYTSDSGMFVTAFYGVYDPATRVLRSTRAGHNPPRLIRADSQEAPGSFVVEPIEGPAGLPLGILEDQSYPCHETALRPGVTDTVAPPRDPSGRYEFYGTERLDAMLARCVRKGRGCSASGLLRMLLDDLNAFSQGAAPVDDQSLLLIKVNHD